jgi:hypothetical protein
MSAAVQEASYALADNKNPDLAGSLKAALTAA